MSKTNTRVWGGELSFGAEYFFSTQFSIGGEFGIRYLHYGYKGSYDRFVYNPILGQSVQTEAKVDAKMNFNPTFSKLSLNFYFGAND